MKVFLATAVIYFATSQAFAQGYDPALAQQFGSSYSLLAPPSVTAATAATTAPAAAAPATPGTPAVAPPACPAEDEDCMNGR